MTDPLRDPATEPHAERPADAVEAPPPKAAKPARESRGGASTLLVLFLFAVLAGGLYYVWTNPKPAPESPEMAELARRMDAAASAGAAAQKDAQALGQQVQTLADRVEKLEHAAAAPAGDTADLQGKLNALTAQVQALASRPAGEGAPAGTPAADTSGLQQQMAELSQKLDATASAQKSALDQVQAAQKQTADAVAQAGQAADALGQRVQKLEQGAGQVESAAGRAARLTRVQAAVMALQAGEKLGDIPDAPPALARFAAAAPPTEAGLRETFPEVAAHAREVSRPDVSQKSFLARALTRLQQSVTVRQGDDVIVGDPAAGILADAEEKVRAGDLAGAVKVLRTLTGPAAEAVRDWIDRAQALIDARAALANLAAHP